MTDRQMACVVAASIVAFAGIAVWAALFKP